MSRKEKVDQFRKLHQGPRILVLPNASDVASARIFEDSGFPAVGTSSAGVAFALGYPDGERMSRDEMIAAVRRIAGALKIPVTADVEAGYGDPLATAESLVEAGAVGMNLEDFSEGSLIDLNTQIQISQQIRSKTDLVINARTDIFGRRIGDPGALFERTVERLNAYRKAGADCLFAPGARDAETIANLVRAVNGALNILATAGFPTVEELERLGVKRVSVGSGPMRAAMGLMQRIARELKDKGTYSTMTEGA